MEYPIDTKYEQLTINPIDTDQIILNNHGICLKINELITKYNILLAIIDNCGLIGLAAKYPNTLIASQQEVAQDDDSTRDAQLPNSTP